MTLSRSMSTACSAMCGNSTPHSAAQEVQQRHRHRAAILAGELGSLERRDYHGRDDPARLEALLERRVDRDLAARIVGVSGRAIDFLMMKSRPIVVSLFGVPFFLPAPGGRGMPFCRPRPRLGGTAGPAAQERPAAETDLLFSGSFCTCC